MKYNKNSCTYNIVLLVLDILSTHSCAVAEGKRPREWGKCILFIQTEIYKNEMYPDTGVFISSNYLISWCEKYDLFLKKFLFINTVYVKWPVHWVLTFK